jgi:hypothetical protein
MRLHNLTAGTSSIHLEPPPRLLNVFLPSLRESDQLCTLELDGSVWAPLVAALKQVVTYHAMISTPPHRDSQHRLQPTLSHLFGTPSHRPLAALLPLDFPPRAADRTDRNSASWWEDWHRGACLAQCPNGGDCEVCRWRGLRGV